MTQIKALKTLQDDSAESVIEYSDLLNATELVNIDNKFEVLYYEQTYF